MIINKLLFLLYVCIIPVFSQQIDILNTGSFKGELNGKSFDAGIKFGTSKNLFIIETSGDDFILTINWPNIESIDELKKQFIKLPADDNSVIINFSRKNTPSQFIVTGGLMHIFRENSQGLNGTLEFTARSRIAKNGKDQVVSLRNGNFRIDLTE